APLRCRISRASSGVAGREAEPFDDADSQAVLKADAHWAPMAAAIAAIGICMRPHHILRMRADAAEDAEHALHQEGRLDQLALREMSEVVQVTDVVHSNSKRVPFADNAVSAYSISLKVFRKTRSRVLSRYWGSQSCLKALNRFSRGTARTSSNPCSGRRVPA